MSRTDKTAPWGVKVLYRPTYLAEHHDHCDGVCDLPPRPRSHRDVSVWRTPGHCTWVPSGEFFASGYARCGCPMCSGEAYEGSRRRRERRAGRRYTQDGWREEY